jgi:hypothetical protein
MRDDVGGCQEARSNVTYLHVRARCPREDCSGCRFCNLWLCQQCGGVEGTLTTGGCPGFRLTQDELDQVWDQGLSARDVQALRGQSEKMIAPG